MFCYKPIKQVIEAAMNDNRDKLLPMLEKLGVKSKMKQDDFALIGKPLMKRVMQTWMPAHEALLEMIVFHLPSPGVAQRYRVEVRFSLPFTLFPFFPPDLPLIRHLGLPSPTQPLR